MTVLFRHFAFVVLVSFSTALPCLAGVTVIQYVAPGATSWPGSPIIQTVANPASQATIGESFNAVGGCTNYCQTFTITTTNYTLQTISIYAGGGTGAGSGTNVTLRLFDLGTQTAPNPSPWVTTWGCGPQLTEPGNLPPAPLANSTLRQFVRITLGGKLVRVRFSNAYGTNSVTINSAHVALSSGAGSAGNGDINTATDKVLTFRGVPSVVIPPGEAILSDPLDHNPPTLTNLAVTIYFGNISATTINGHPGSRMTSFIQAGNVVTAASLPSASKTAHWYIITGVEVLADASSKAVVTLGDSITDGRGSTTDDNDRWPDNLAARLSTNMPTAGVSVVNMGIGGNAIFGGLGPAAVNRFDRDVLNQNGARWLIVFEGVNDIGGVSDSGAPALTTNLINAYTQFANKAHARVIRAYGATITPFGENGYYTTAREAARQTVNVWFRTNTIYDGVIDFDAIVRDPVTLTNLLSTYDTGDHLHLNPTGYRAMADAIDLNLFTP